MPILSASIEGDGVINSLKKLNFYMARA
jgi:hypothetical protein